MSSRRRNRSRNRNRSRSKEIVKPSIITNNKCETDIIWEKYNNCVEAKKNFVECLELLDSKSTH